MEPRFANLFAYKHLKITEQRTTQITQYIDEACNFIDECLTQKHGTIIVHCLAGVNRSVSLVIAYLMKRDKISFQEAFDRVFSKRNIINPSEVFIKQLKDWEKKQKQ